MLYRLLLPCFERVPATRITEALAALGRECTRTSADQWFVRSLEAPEPGAYPVRLVVKAHATPDIQQKPSDKHFHRPRGVLGWIEVRATGERVDRPGRMRARLVALELSKRLMLAVLETRNGVYCRTAAAFAAWCAREEHPQTIPLTKREHTTPAFPRTVHQPPMQPAATHVRATPAAPLPKQPWPARMLRRLTGVRPFVITLPEDCNPTVIDGLVQEVKATFRARNVVYQDCPRRLVIYGRDTSDSRRLIAYFRHRAHPHQLGLSQKYSGL